MLEFSHFYTVWTVRVKPVQLGALFEAFNETYEQQLAFQRLYAQKRIHVLSKLPSELVAMICRELHNAVFDEALEKWSAGIKCSRGCTVQSHLTTEQHEEIQNLLERPSPFVPSHGTIKSNYRMAASDHYETVEKMAHRICVTGDTELSSKFYSAYGVRPIFLSESKHTGLLDSDQGRSINAGIVGIGRPIYAYLALPTSHVLRGRDFTAEADRYWDHETLCIVNRAKSKRMVPSEDEKSRFERALRYLGLSALPDHCDDEPGDTGIGTFKEVVPVLRGVGTLTARGWPTLGRYRLEASNIKRLGRHYYKYKTEEDKSEDNLEDESL